MLAMIPVTGAGVTILIQLFTEDPREASPPSKMWCGKTNGRPALTIAQALGALEKFKWS